MTDTIVSFPGRAALSIFGLQKVQARDERLVYAQFVHLLTLSAPLTDEQTGKVTSLLQYGPTQELPEPCGVPLVTVLPLLSRLG